MKKGNPFTLTFGKVPQNYIDRVESKNEIIDSFTDDPAFCQTYLIMGVRGSGKTVLMTEVARELENEYKWITIDLNPANDLLEEMYSNLSFAFSNTDKVTDRGVNVSLAGFGAGIGEKKAQEDPVSGIKTLLEKAKKKNKKILITIDEVENNENMKRFASQFQIFIRRDYPIFLIMTGLYENIYQIQNNPALTFLLRSPKIEMGPLVHSRIVRKYQELLGVDDKVAGKLASLTGGYAFAFQALGSIYWENKDAPDEKEICAEYDSLLEEFVYRKIWDGLSDNDRKIVLAINDSETKVGNVCEACGITNEVFSKYRERLIIKQIIEAPKHGYVKLKLPRFNIICKNFI